MTEDQRSDRTPGEQGSAAPEPGPSEEQPSPDARHQGRMSMRSAVLTVAGGFAATVVGALLTVYLADNDGSDGGGASPSSSVSRVGEHRLPPAGGGGEDSESPSPKPSWVLSWEDQEFRFPPPNGDRRLIDFDGPYGPNVSEAIDVEFDESSHPGDLDYWNDYHGSVDVMPGRKIGRSSSDRPEPEQCLRDASSKSISIDEIPFMDDQKTPNSVKTGDGLCLVTDKGNVVWIKVRLIDPNPGEFEVVRDSYTLEGAATMWSRG